MHCRLCGTPQSDDALVFNYFSIGPHYICKDGEACQERQANSLSCEFCGNHRQDELTQDPWQEGNWGRCIDQDMCLVRVREEEAS